MLKEITAEAFKLTKDFTFIRNLSLTSILAISCLCSLSELQSQNTRVSEQASITNISNSSSIKIIVERQ